jgi:hypothetical protein
VALWDGVEWEPWGNTGTLLRGGYRINAQPSQGGGFAVAISSGIAIFNPRAHRVLTTGPGLPLRGSVDGDSALDISDVVILVNHISGEELIEDPAVLTLADINSDEAVDAADLQVVIDSILRRQ